MLMNKSIILFFLIFSCCSIFAQVSKKVDPDYSPEEIQYILSQKQIIKSQTNKDNPKFANISPSSKMSAAPQENKPDKTALIEKIAYLRDMSCCEDEISELARQLKELND